MSVIRSLIFKFTAEISVIAQISVIQVTVVSCVSVQKSEMLPQAPLREGGRLAQACSKRRGESANTIGF